jgi:hypothetical protein
VDVERIFVDDRPADPGIGSCGSEIVAGPAFGEDDGEGVVECCIRITCEPVVGEHAEVIGVGKDGVRGFRGLVRIVVGAGFNARDLLFKGCRGWGWGILAVPIFVVFGYAGADAVNAVAAGVEVIKAEFVGGDGIDGDAGANAGSQAGHIDEGEAFVA